MILTAKEYAEAMGVKPAAISMRIKRNMVLPGVLSSKRVGNYYQLRVGKNFNSDTNKKKFKK